MIEEDDDAAALLQSLDELQASVDDVKALHPFDGPVYRAAAIVSANVVTARAATLAQHQANEELNRSLAGLERALADTETPPVLQ